jgi:Type VI secretion system/phage-baseplate injector OB domain
MSWHEALVNLIHREVLRVMHRNTRRTPVIVDSYDPATHAAKFKLMPDSMDQAVITGWVPLHTPQTGNNYGWHQPPNIGDHGWLDFHEDDREGATFTGAAFNDQLKPLQTQAGELQYQTIWGHTIYFKQDGSLTFKNGNKSGAGGTAQKPPGGSSTQGSIVIDPSGNVTITGVKIILAGTVYLGGADASNAVAMLGSVDSHGDTEQSNLATKAFAK